MQDRIEIDLHCHTCHSYDGWTRPADLIRRARATGLNKLCVTDHGTIDGALEARDLDPDLVLVGQEVRCADGTELIGLMIDEPIAGGMTVERSAEAIRVQGGLVYVPHPYAYWSAGERRAQAAAGVADIVEIYNPRAFLPRWNRRARELGELLDMPVAAASDAHFPWEIGRARTVVRPFGTAAELRSVLRDGDPVGASALDPVSHILSQMLVMSRRIAALF